jgi:hypothetical protein
MTTHTPSHSNFLFHHLSEWERLAVYKRMARLATQV